MTPEQAADLITTAHMLTQYLVFGVGLIAGVLLGDW